MIRSRPLRTMDHQCGEMICELMERDGVKFIMPAHPRSFSSQDKPAKLDNAKLIRPGVWEHGKDVKGNIQYLHESGMIEVEHTDGKKTWIHPKGAIEVKYEYADQRQGKIHSENYDTGKQRSVEQSDNNFDKIFYSLVLMAIGRTANISDIGLDKIGVHVVNGKILVDEQEQTNVSHIYALGDVATGTLRLRFSSSSSCFQIVV
jgi:NADPH-dependent glutamate synthase beta subunit-like oxidoreductase